MKQVLIKSGQAVAEDVPAPQVEPGTILVRVDHSCISVGTEMSGVRANAQPLWKRAIRKPQLVAKALKMVATQGLGRTVNVVQGKLQAGQATGYSAAGVVLEVGEGVHDIRPGDRVACAGAQCAYHAEIICVPRNLGVLVPETVPFREASTVALGAIALQGIRRAQPSLGETFVVIGLGFLGQLSVQMLQANGCRTVGMDLDPARIDLANSLGMTLGIRPDDDDAVDRVMRLTDGHGADGVIITAATPSHQVVSTAFRMCRRKGRVILVGDVGLNLSRGDFYQKEIDFLISTSYGPGRYDASYEERGQDYPIGYVRWTENRNMSEYLRLIADGGIHVSPLITKVFPVEECTAAYDALKSTVDRPLLVVLAYPVRPMGAEISRKVRNPFAKAAGPSRIRIAIAGAGSFAKEMHLPNLQSLSDRYHIQAVVSRQGHNAVAVATQFGGNYAATDFQQVLHDPEVDAVLVSTRHNLHAGMVLEALRAGKHVLVEKPLALSIEELAAIEAFYAGVPEQGDAPVLLTGFNRRFSAHARRIQELTARRSNPMILNYRMNAGYIPLDHWVHTSEGGGRNLGEACHIYDLFTFLTGSQVKSVHACSATPATGYYSPRDNFVATMTFADGSVATLTYTALGTRDYPKEQLEVFVDGQVIKLNDYRQVQVFGTRAKGSDTQTIDKGHRNELKAFADAIQQGGAWPIPLWQQVQATDISLRVEEQLLS